MQQLPLDFKQSQKSSINNILADSLPYDSPEIQKVFSGVHLEQATKEDTLGTLFEKLIGEVERKNLGQFYTPKEIVKYMLEYLKIETDSKILDPTCGCGVFLTTAYEYLSKVNKNAFQNLYGVDLNETATKLTQISLWAKNGMTDETLEILEKNIKVGNSIVENPRIDAKAFSWDEEFKQVLQDVGFDFIIGNPPYVTLKKGRDYDPNESSYSLVANGSVNAASLVISRSFDLLRKGGIMAFVLPKTILRVSSYSKLRQFILDNSKVLHIVDLGKYFSEVRGEQIIMFLQKVSGKNSTKKNQVLIRLLTDKKKPLGKQEKFYIPQSLFEKYSNFLILEDKNYYSLIDKISNRGQPLGELSEIFRGLALSPNSKSVRKETDKKDKLEPIIKGKNISKLDFDINYFVDTGMLNKEQSKKEKLRKKKIVLQNIFSSESGMISAIDNQGLLTFDTVTNVLLTNHKVSLEYILGLFNSKLLNFYLIYALFNKSKLTMHTDGIYLGKLPIVTSHRHKQKKVQSLVRSLRKTKSSALQRELDDYVYDLYKISQKEQKLIDKGLRSIMSSKNFQ